MEFSKIKKVYMLYHINSINDKVKKNQYKYYNNIKIKIDLKMNKIIFF